jgi:hypothetical protein
MMWRWAGCWHGMNWILKLSEMCCGFLWLFGLLLVYLVVRWYAIYYASLRIFFYYPPGICVFILSFSFLACGCTCAFPDSVQAVLYHNVFLFEVIFCFTDLPIWFFYVYAPCYHLSWGTGCWFGSRVATLWIHQSRFPVQTTTRL